MKNSTNTSTKETTSIIVIGILIAILTVVTQVAHAQNLSKPEKEIVQLFNKTANDKSIHSAFLSIYSKSLDLNVTETFGEGLNTELFYTASITKTFTATLIGKLVDAGNLKFEDPMSNYLDDSLIAGLHVLDGIEYTNEITIQQLLGHTSGLADYFEDEPISGSNMMSNIFEEPNLHWAPEDIIHFTKDHFKAQFRPGNGYHYTDTEYVLLGLIIEKVTGLQLHLAFKRYIFTPLVMKSTYMNLRDSVHVKMSPLYAEGIDVSEFRSLSADWAGGGLISTQQDLLVFMQALFCDQLVSDTSWTAMTEWTKESRGIYYGLGLRLWKLKELFPSLPDLTLIGHSGSTGSFMYYSPELDTFFVGTFNQTKMIKKHIKFLVRTMVVINKELK